MARQSSRAVGLAAAALFVISACSAGASGSPGGSGSASGSTRPSTGSSGSATASLTARRALLATARQEQKVKSATEVLLVRVSGTQSITTGGTIQIRRKPTFAIREDLSVAANGQSTHLKGILTDAAFYLHQALLARKIGRPWLEIPLSAVHQPLFASFAQLVRSARNNDFLDMPQLFAAVKNARVVGTGSLGGVPVTEYAGSFRAAQVVKSLGASARKALGPALQTLGNSIVTFHIWIDRQHYTRKMTEVETVNGEVIHTRVIATKINQPVRILLPPKSQIYAPSGG
jgi:hypothetical protein